MYKIMVTIYTQNFIDDKETAKVFFNLLEKTTYVLKKLDYMSQ